MNAEVQNILDQILKLSERITSESKKDTRDYELIRDYSSKIGAIAFQLKKLMPSA
jgi:regulator of PEP synthase PpsR (kinase-PPPase family)